MNYKTTTNIKSSKNNKRKKFFFIAGNIDNGVGYDLWKGVLIKTKEIDVDLICLIGGLIEENNGSMVYNRINLNTIDGFISHVVTISDKYMSFYDKLKGHPLVALSVPILNFPVVLVDSYQGMRDVVEHLVNVHSYTKIAFVRGPKRHGYAIQRYSGYIDVVKENNIYDENLITPPLSFMPNAGVEGIQILLDERKLKPGKDIEAIVFISDKPALSAFNELKSRNILVPDQIAITGCNASPEALYATPPFTTVTMPFVQQSYIATNLLLKLLNNEEVPMQTTISSKILIAQSCGCQSSSVENAAIEIEKSHQIENNQDITSSSNTCKDTIAIKSRKVIENEIIIDINKHSQSKDINEPILTDFSRVLCIAFLDELGNNKEGVFLLHLDELARELIKKEYQVEFLQDIISIFRRNLYKNIKKTSTIQVAENLCSQALVMISEKSSRIRKKKTLAFIKQNKTLRDISVKLITNYNVDLLMDILVNNLPILGIPSCYISFYEKPDSITSFFDIPEKARLIFAYDNGKRRDLNNEDILYPSKDLLPKGFNTGYKRKTMIVQSLNFNDIQMGFIQFELGPEEGSIYNILSILLSSALKGAFLLNETLQKSEKLNEAYQSLQRNQKQLLSNEKMASLGRLTAGIAHEMNTPLATIQATMKELKNLVTEYSDSINHSEILPEDHREIAKDMKRCIDLSIKSAEKSSSFIRGIKGQTSSMNVMAAERFAASNVIIDTLNLLEFKFKQSRCQLVTEIDNTIVLFGNPRGLSQIIANMINNALEASKGKNGTITVRLKTLDNSYAQLIVEDNGTGIPEKNLQRIFDPFFSTKPFGNSLGLGLGIVKDLVDQFKGTINVKCNNGITQFTIEIPLADRSN